MKLYIKQKVFAFTDTFNVKDEYGNDKYFVEGEFFSFGHKLHIYDNNNNEVAFIREKLFTFRPRFEITINGSVIGELVKKITFFNSSYFIEGSSLELEGDFFSHEYTLSDKGHPIMEISKQWFTWGDSYELDIANPGDELLSLAVALAVDCQMCTESSNNH